MPAIDEIEADTSSPLIVVSTPVTLAALVHGAARCRWKLGNFTARSIASVVGVEPERKKRIA